MTEYSSGSMCILRGLIYDTAPGVSSSAFSCCSAWESSEVFGLKSVFHLVSMKSDSANPLRSHLHHDATNASSQGAGDGSEARCQYQKRLLDLCGRIVEPGQ